jgi:hypothetical protein
MAFVPMVILLRKLGVVFRAEATISLVAHNHGFALDFVVLSLVLTYH